MKREDLPWIIPLLEKLRDNPEAVLMYEGTKRALRLELFSGDAADYSVLLPRKYRIYARGQGPQVYCLTSDEARVPTIEKDPSVTWLTDWLPVPTGP